MAELSDFLNEAENAFNQSCHAVGLYEQTILVAGAHVRLQFAGREIQTQLMPALAHLAAPSNSSGCILTIKIWDSKAAGESLPAPRWSQGEAATLAGFNQPALQSVYAYFNTDSRAFSCIDIKNCTAFFWTPDSSLLPVYERGAPFLFIFHWWLANQGSRLVHAGAVGTSRGAVLLAGRGGSGKSTTSVACLARGLSYLADDYCIVTMEPSLFVYSLYNTAKLTKKSYQLLSQWLPELDDARWDHQEKQHFFLHQMTPDQLSIRLPIRAILLPSLNGVGGPSVSMLNPAIALRELAPSTIFQLRGASESGLRLMRRLVQDLPCFTLNLTSNVLAVPEVVRELIEGL